MTQKEELEFKRIPLDLIDTNPLQPRKIFKEESIDKLAVSIQEETLLQKPMVKPTSDGRYEIICGERRVRARRKAGAHDELFVVWRGDQSVDTYVKSLVENLHHEQMNPMDEAMALQRLRDKGMPFAKISMVTGMLEQTIKQKIRLLALPERIKNMIRDGTLPQMHALNLLRGKTAKDKELIRMAHAYMHGEMSNEIAERFASLTDQSIHHRISRLPTTGEGLLQRVLKNSWQFSSTGLAIDSFLKLSSEEQMTAWETFSKRTQDGLKEHLRNIAVSAQKLLSAWDSLYTAAGTPEDQQRQHRRQALTTVARLLRGVMYKGMSINVNLGSRSVQSLLHIRGNSERAEHTLRNALKVVEKYWYHGMRNAKPGEEEFVEFIEVLRKDFGVTEFSGFIRKLVELNTSKDAINIAS